MHTEKPEAEIRVRVKRSPRGFFRKLFLLVVSLYIGFITYGFIHDLLVTRLAKVEQLQEGVIQSSVPVRGILVRSERVVNSPRTGKLKIVASEGERVRVGQLVAQVIAPSLENKSGEAVFNITAPQAGLVSYHLDGLEQVYTPAGLNTLVLDKAAAGSQPREFSGGSQLEAGKPVLKIVNNLTPLLVIVDPTGQKVKPPAAKKTVLLTIGENDQKIYQGKLVSGGFHDTAGRFLLSLNNYDQGLIRGRQVDLQIIRERFEGYVVPAGAIIRKEGKDGIFTVYKEHVKWKSVVVKGRAEDKAVISGVTPDIKVILSPEYVKEGASFKPPNERDR